MWASFFKFSFLDTHLRYIVYRLYYISVTISIAQPSSYKIAAI